MAILYRQAYAVRVQVCINLAIVVEPTVVARDADIATISKLILRLVANLIVLEQSYIIELIHITALFGAYSRSRSAFLYLLQFRVSALFIEVYGIYVTFHCIFKHLGVICKIQFPFVLFTVQQSVFKEQLQKFFVCLKATNSN